MVCLLIISLVSVNPVTRMNQNNKQTKSNRIHGPERKVFKNTIAIRHKK